MRVLYISVALATVFAATMFPFMIRLQNEAPPVMVGHWRMAISAIIFFPFMLFEICTKLIRNHKSDRMHIDNLKLLKLVLYSSIGYALYNGMIAVANQNTIPSHVVLLSQSSPIILGIHSIVFSGVSGESKRNLFSAITLFGIGSLWMVLGSFSVTVEDESGVTILGDICAFIAAFGLAISTSYEFEARKYLSTFTYMFIKLAITGMFLLMWSLAFEKEASLSIFGWTLDQNIRDIIFIGLVPGLFSLGIIGWAAAKLPPLHIAAIQGTEPVVAICLSVFMGQESIQNYSLISFAGCFAVLCSCYWIIRVQHLEGIFCRKYFNRMLYCIIGLSIFVSSYYSMLALHQSDFKLRPHLGGVFDQFEASTRMKYSKLYQRFIILGENGSKSKPVLTNLYNDNPVNTVVHSCMQQMVTEFKTTLQTCFHYPNGVKFLDPVTLPTNFDFTLFGTASFPLYYNQKHRMKEMCSLNRTDGRFGFDRSIFVDPISFKQRIFGRLPGLWGPNNTLGDKSQLCKLSTHLKNEFDIKIAPACFSLPSDYNVMKSQINHLAASNPFWIFKPAMSTSGKGIHFVTSEEISNWNDSSIDGTIQSYMHNPLLYDRSMEKYNYANTQIKIDLRIYGVQTSVQPMRLFISKHGYFRTGDADTNFTMSVDFSENEFIHATNNGGKIRSNRFVNNEYALPNKHIPYDYKTMEDGVFTSAGTLQKFWKIVEANGLNKESVWGNIVTLFAEVHAGGQSWMSNGCKSKQIGSENLCSNEFIPFFADVGVDENGEVILFETHPANNFKVCNTHGVEMEGCYHPIVTEFGTRPATWGSTAMGFARFIEADFQVLVKEWISSQLIANSLSDGTSSTELSRCEVNQQQSSLIENKCLSEEAEDVLIQMAHEDYLSCKLGLQDTMYVLKGIKRRWIDRMGIKMNENKLLNELEGLLDETTLEFYRFYRLFRLGDFAQHYSGKICNSVQNEWYFGRGENHGCKF